MRHQAVYKTNGLPTLGVIFAFCSFILVAFFYQDEVKLSTVENNANVVTASKQIRNITTTNTPVALASREDVPRVVLTSSTTIAIQDEVTIHKPKTKNRESATSKTSPKTIDTDTTVIVKNDATLTLVEDVAEPFTRDALYVKTLIQLIEEMTNSFRIEEGLNPLVYSSTLETNAQKYSEVMLAGNFLSHTNKIGCSLTCRFSNDGYTATAWGENLATISFTKKQSPEEVASFFMGQWKKSAGHRDNLVSEQFTHQGIGIAVSATSVYATVQFAKP